MPSYIDAHFAADTHKLGKREQQRIAEEVAEIDDLIGNKETLRQSDFVFLEATSLLIAALGESKKNRLQCIVC